MFRDKGVRLIAINDRYDSDRSEDDDFTPFKEIIHEWYARDASRKVKSALHSKGKDGKPLGNTPIYGYIKDPDDKNKRLIDPESAEVVRRIFQMAASGKGPVQIARILMDEKVERPSYYMIKHGIVPESTRYDMSLQYNWRGSTISQMISHREYMGDLVNFKTNKPSYKSKNFCRNPKDKHIIFEGAMPAIVDRDLWELAQKCRRTVRRPDRSGNANPLTGLIYCADCGAKMTNHRNTFTGDENGVGSYKQDIYECSANRAAHAKYVKLCSQHYIRSVVLRKLILDTIRTVSTYARDNETEFVEKVREASTLKQAEAVKSHKRRLSKNG
jgi:hypothetical protein